MKDIVEATKEQHLEVLEDWYFSHGVSGVPDFFFNGHSVMLYKDDVPLCYLQICVDYQSECAMLGHIIGNPEKRGFAVGKALKELVVYGLAYLKAIGVVNINCQTDSDQVIKLYKSFGFKISEHTVLTGRL